jgi:putative FmdB family regulatory protein
MVYALTNVVAYSLPRERNMPLYDIECLDCGHQGEVLVTSSGDKVACPSCGGTKTRRLMSAPSSLTGRASEGLPGPGDHSCCGSRPSEAGCAGPGSCCGKA